MSDAAEPAPGPSADPEPEGEDAPETWTEDGYELEMVRGNATERTADAVVFVDARCVGCENVSVCNVPHGAADDWTEKSTFADRCKVCSVLTPHNIISLLTGLNRSHDRGYLNRGDD